MAFSTSSYVNCLFGSSMVNRFTSLPSGPKTNTAGIALMFSFSKPSPKFSSRRTLVKAAFLSLRNFSASPRRPCRWGRRARGR